MSESPATSTSSHAPEATDPVARWLDDPADAGATAALFDGVTGEGLEAVLKRVEEAGAGRPVDARLSRAWTELALRWRDVLKRTDRAEQLFQRAMAADPGAVKPIEELARLMEDLGRFVDLAATLERLAAGTGDGPARAVILEKLGTLQDQKLAQSEKALVNLLGAFRADRGRLGALRAARAIHVRAAREELAKQLLDQEADALSAGEPTDAQLAELADAYASVAQALVTRPALHAVGEDAARRAMTLVPDHPRAAAARASIADFGNTWQDHVRQLRDEALEAREKRTASQHYLSIAQIYHRYAKDTARALEFLDKSLLLTPGYRPSLKFLEQVHRGAGTTDVLLQKLQKLAADAKDPDVAVEIHLMAAVLLAEQQAPRPALAAAYGRVLDLDPSNKSALNALLELVLEDRNHDEAVRRLQAYAAATSSTAERKWALYTMARLEDVEQGNVEGAISRYEAILEMDAQDRDSLENLERLYARANRPQDYVRVLEALKSRAQDDRERLRCLDLLARTYGAELRMPELAFEAHRVAFALDPRPARESELARLAEQLGRQADLGDTLVKSSPRVPAGPDRNGMLIRAARLFHAAQDARRAREALDPVLASDPSNRQALEILESLSARGADARDLVVALKQRLAAGVAPSDRRALLVRLARLYAEELREVQEAVSAWREVLALDSEDPEALTALDDLLRKDERWTELASVLRARLAAQPDAPDAPALRMRLARACEERLDRPDEAAELYLQLLVAEPGRADLIGALERLLTRNVMVQRIAAVLEPHYARTGGWRRYVEMLDIRRGGTEDVQARVALSREAARVFETELRSPREAFKALSVALVDDPASADLPGEVDRLAAAARMQAELCDVLQQAASGLPEGNARIALLSRRAALLAEALGRDGDAVAAHRALVGAHPRLLSSWDALVKLHARHGEWGPVADALEAAAGVAGDQVRHEYLVKLGDVALRELKDHARAALAYEPLRGHMDEKVRDTALAALDTCYMHLREWTPLVAVLADRAAMAQGPARADLRARQAEVLQAHLKDPGAALDALEASLEADAACERARHALEKVLAEAEPAALRLRAARLLEPAYRAAQDSRGLARVLAVRMDNAARPEERRELVVALALTHARDLRQPQAALDLLSAHLRRDPQDEAARRELENVARFANRADAVLQTFQAIVDDGGAASVDYARRLGVLHERSGDRDASLKAWNHVLAQLPDDQEALQASVRLRRQSSDARPLAETLEQMAESQPPEQRAQSLREAAGIWVRVNEADRALRALERALEARPDDVAALRSLVELHDLRDDDAAVAASLDRLASHVGDPEKSSLLVRLARIRVEKLQDRDGAMDALTLVLASSPSDAALAEALAQLEALARSTSPEGAQAASLLAEHYRSTSAPAPLAALLEHRAAALPTSAERARTLDEVSRLYEEALAQKEPAFMAAGRAFREEPTEERRARAETLAAAIRAWDAFAGVLEDVAEATAARDPVGAAARWREVARVATERQNDRALAIRAFREILRLVPGDADALKALEDFHRAGAETDALVDVLKAKAAAMPQGPARKDTLLQAARLLADDRADLAGAEALFRQLLAENADDPQVLALADALFARSGNNAGLVEVLSRRVNVETEGTTRAQIGARLGRLLLESAGGAVAAFAVLQKAAEDDGRAPEVAQALGVLLDAARNSGAPPARDVARVLERCLRARNDVATLPAVLEARLVGEPDAAERARVLVELAQVHEELARNPTLAFMAICRAVREAPTDEGIRERAERLAQATDSMEALAAVYEDVLEQTRDGRLVALLSRRVAGIAETRLRDVDGAIGHLRNALLAVPDDVEALEQMARLLRQKGPGADLMDALRRLSRLHSAANRLEPARAALEELAGVADTLGDAGGAVSAWQEVLNMQPGHRAALRALEKLFARTERYQDLAGVLELQVQHAQNPAEAGEARIRLAEVRRGPLADPVTAASILALAAQEAPGNPRLLPALEANYADLAVRVGPDATRARMAMATLLEPRYESLGDAQKLVSVMEARLDGVTDPEQRRAMWRRVASLREGPLRSPELAFAALGRALKEQPGDESLRADTERLAQATGDLDTLVGLYLDVLEQENLGALALLYRRRVATLFESGLQDAPRAVEHHRLALDQLGPAEQDTPEHRAIRVEILQTLERLHREYSEPAALVDVLRRRAALETDARVQRQLLVEVARLQGALQDTSGSIVTLRKMLEQNPQDLDILKLLQQACEKQERWQDLVEALFREAELCKGQYPDRELEALHRAGVVLDAELERTDDALGAFHRVLATRPDHAPTRAYLEGRLRTRSTQRTLTAPLLLEAYRATREWRPAIDVLELLVADAEGAGDRERARFMLTEIADVFEKQLDLQGPAFGALCRALKVDRANKAIRTRLLDLARRQGTVEELAEVYEDEASGADLEGRTPVAAELREAAAALHETELGAPERAVELYEQVLQKAPGRLVPLESLQRLYAASERWSDLEATVRKRLAVADGKEERAPLLRALGSVLGRHLGAHEEAVEALEEAATLDPEDAETRRELIHLCEQVGNHARQAELLAVEVEFLRARGDVKALHAAQRQLVDVLAGQLERHADALPHLVELHAANPRDQDLFDKLERLLRALEKWPELKALYEEELTREKDSGRVTDLSARLGQLLTDHLGEIDNAIAKYTRVLELDPRDLGALDALRRIYRKARRWEDLVGVLRRLRRLQTDSAGIKAVQFDLAEVFQAQGKRMDAIEAGRRVLDIEPHTAEELQRLQEIFHACEAWEESAGVLERRVGLAPDDASRMALLFDLAELWEGPLGRKERAASAYERILQIDPAHARAHAMLAAAYEHAEDWRKLVTLKEARLHHATDRDEKVRLLTGIAALYEQRLGEKSLAFLAACRAFRENPMDRAMGAAMERLAVETDSAEELVVVLEDAVGDIDDTQRAIEVYLKMAELCAEQLGESEQAEQHLNVIFDLDAQNAGALNALERLYTASLRWADVIRVMERRYATLDDDEEKKQLLYRMAGVWEERLQDKAEAINTFRRVLELDGRDPRAVQSLTRLYEETEKWQALIGIFSRALELSDNPQERVTLRYRIAGIQESQLQDLEAAIATYRQVLEEDPGHGLSLKALERIYTQLDRTPELLSVFERQLAHASGSDHEEAARLLAKMANLQEETFGNVRAAVDATERILQVDPRNIQAVRKLEMLFKELGDSTRLIGALQRHAEITNDADEKLDLQLQIAEIYYRDLNKPDQAEAIYNRVLQYDPGSIRAIHALGQLYERSGNWFNALEKLAQEAELLKGRPEAVETYYRMGTINADMLMDQGAARGCYEQALALDPEHVPSLQALKAMHFSSKEWEAYLKRLVQEAEATKDTAAKTDLFSAAGAFVLERNSDLEGAARYFERALQIAPDHLGAARPLADIEFRRERFARAEELLDIVVQKLDPTTDNRELCRQYYRLGYITEKQGKDQKALKNYQRAYDIDPTYLPALEGLGSALLRAERWEDAQKIHQTILIHHRESLTDAEVVDYYFKLGDIGRKLNQEDRAIRNLEKALEIDGNHAPSLLLLADVHAAAGRNEEAYEALMKLASLSSGDEKVQLLMRLGTLSQQKLQDPYRAIDAWEDANKLKKDDKDILNALLGLYRETKQGPKAVEVLEDLVRIEPDEQTRVRLNHTLGEVYRDEVRNDLRAVQYFNAALDLDATYVRSFEAIERLLTEKRQWRALEENYRAMIQRTPKDQVKIRGVLWKNLAELYAQVLKDVENAVVAYQVLLKMDPENLAYDETLAELMSRRPGHEDEAIAQYNKVLPRSEAPAPHLHALARLYLTRRNPDRAFLAIHALRILKEVTDEEMQVLNAYAPHVPQRATKGMTQKLWDALVVHERAQTPLATVSSILFRLAPHLALRDVKDLGLAKRRDAERVEVEQSLVFSMKQLSGVAGVFGTTLPEVWKLKGHDLPPTLQPVVPLTITVGDQNPMYKEMPPRLLWALWGRTISYLQPAFVLPRTLGPAAFRPLVEAALFMTDTGAKFATDPRELEKLARQLVKVEGLEAALRTVRGAASRSAPPNVEQLFEGMEHTAVRAALIASNDVETTLQVLKIQDPQSPAPPKNRLREFILYLVSDQLAEIRTRMGLALRAG